MPLEIKTCQPILLLSVSNTLTLQEIKSVITTATEFVFMGVHTEIIWDTEWSFYGYYVYAGEIVTVHGVDIPRVGDRVSIRFKGGLDSDEMLSTRSVTLPSSLIECVRVFEHEEA